MPDEQRTIEHGAAARPPDERRAEPVEPWLADDEATELPPRPRRRLLSPLPLALLAALAIACGFIAGVLVEKGQQGSSGSGSGASGASGLAARFAALRGGSGAGGAGAASGSGSTSSSASGSTPATGLGRLGGGAGATVGQVAYVSHGALYVTTLEGNTVKVTAAPGATVTKSVTTQVGHIHPGETVIVTGATSASGAIAAQSIRAGAAAAGGLGGGAQGLFGGARTSGAGAGASGAGTSGGSGEQALFGKG